MADDELRRRKGAAEGAQVAEAETAETAVEDSKKEDVVLGRTPDGTVFKVPHTSDVLTSLFHPAKPKTHLDLLTLITLASQVLLFALLPLRTSRVLFFLLFTFWRLSYNLGLGYVLRKQSEKRWIVGWVKRMGWFDKTRRPGVRKWVEEQVRGKMGEGYEFDACPVEYNTWLFFRHCVDVILLNDFVSYSLFAWAHCRLPEGHGWLWHVLRWVGGWAMIFFNLWVKVDAHRVVKDYAWYWGDAFFQQIQSLVFDGVFELAPHPMYSIGYAGFYGLSLVVGSYRVLFVSLFAHAAQFGFLLWFENPHIERTYGERKPIAARVPLTTEAAPAESPATTPTLTASAGTETETELESLDGAAVGVEEPEENGSPTSTVPKAENKRPQTLHDLEHKYFDRDLTVFKNFDLFRANDFSTLALLLYALLPSFLPALSRPSQLALYFLHALAWRALHSFGLGLALRKQSEEKWLVRHYIKWYARDDAEAAKRDAFGAWKQVYNTCLVMTYASYLALAWKTYTLPTQWTVGTELLRHTIGTLLVALQVWCALETHEVIGDFGWFFGNFFLDEYPSKLYYTGIYRYLNDPERSMGGAALFGLALISGSRLTLTMALISYLAHWWFLSYVENPHTRKLYGDAVRRTGGAAKTLKNAACSNSFLLSGKGQHVERLAKEVQGTVEKVYDETVEVVEEFLKTARPQINQVVKDTRVLLQQSRERLVITRVDKDLSPFDLSKYSITVQPSSSPREPMSFHLGEPIRIAWTAPANHSRKDWVGIYRVGANKDALITRVSSQGKWVAIHSDEYEGARPVPAKRPEDVAGSSSFAELQNGVVTLRGDALPWASGKYELRYHHAGKHNVMASCGPIEIFVDRPTDPDVLEPIHNALSRSVAYALDLDPALVPPSAWHLLPESVELPAPGSPEADRDPDDMVIMHEKQARRVALAIRESFAVEFTPQVVIADANTGRIAQRVLDTRRLLGMVERKSPAVTQG